MHSFNPGYAHNDVKPGNVLITRRKGQAPVATLMDFGSARPTRKEIRSRSEVLQLQVCQCQLPGILTLMRALLDELMLFIFMVLKMCVHSLEIYLGFVPRCVDRVDTLDFRTCKFQ